MVTLDVRTKEGGPYAVVTLDVRTKGESHMRWLPWTLEQKGEGLLLLICKSFVLQ